MAVRVHFDLNLCTRRTRRDGSTLRNRREEEVCRFGAHSVRFPHLKLLDEVARSGRPGMGITKSVCIHIPLA